MTLHVVTNKQLTLAVISIAIFISITVAAVMLYINYLDLPEVFKQDGKCIKVINNRNGDSYGCQDVDVILRRYKIKQNEAMNEMQMQPPSPSITK